jgi:uncharacterized protein YeaO (DUF488 family)
MTSIHLKRVYEAADPADGLRVLVDRLWPRGLRKADAAVDEWQKDLAPSPELRTWWNHDPERLDEFAERYRAELDDNPAVGEFARRIAGERAVTLLYAAKDEHVNHARILGDYLREH